MANLTFLNTWNGSFAPMNGVSAIQTKYKGYRFRSRLEARWAVFLDALHCRWMYEREGFNLGGEYYLPDFWISLNCGARPNPVAGLWLEVKPSEPTGRELLRCQRLSELTRHHVCLAAGMVGWDEFDCHCWPAWQNSRTSCQRSPWGTWRDNPPDLGCALFATLIKSAASPEIGEPVAALRRALDAARSARFEHGERP